MIYFFLFLDCMLNSTASFKVRHSKRRILNSTKMINPETEKNDKKYEEYSQ